ncbi:MBL fold metallo-hydrolase [Rhodocytophaga aerolata]|uniref:MBL fold metallo-hydrolase n=1 Tax=Rhodocytophaga aerolata TaxID=455078 RepID=A0ABT8RC78_9BACT|nr:MBL fold metallo-hydrolase [Rhodocytophaga aerolata]MDO1449703.1 MBL fold metallo-hydrolase [Rhodocytophaga aerolata]
MNITITHIDTACVLLDINGFRILTDPTLDTAGKLYYHGSGTFSRKTENPALPLEQLPTIDLVLLSHHQHKDNFDHRGQEFTKTVPIVISTKPAAKAIPGVIGLDNWESYTIHTQAVTNLTITATPAQHHPWWVPEFLAGKVIGFILSFEEQQKGVIYISGDTVYFKGIEEVGERYKIDIGIFHMGSVQFRYLTGFGQYTMDSHDLLKAVKVLNLNSIIPIHHKGWTHFKETENKLKQVIAGNEQLRSKTLFLKSGIQTRLW